MASKISKNRRFYFSVALLFTVVLVLARLLPHEPNFSPLGAVSLFAGYFLLKNSKALFFIVFLALYSGDIILGGYEGQYFVYGSFALVGLLGFCLKDSLGWGKFFLVNFVAAALFFLVTNFGVWVVTPYYAKNFSGMLECYTLALPFFRSTLVSQLFFSTLISLAYKFVFFKPYSFRRPFEVLKP